MNIEIDIDGLRCDGKLVMVWADPSDIPARERLIDEFPDDEKIADLEAEIDELDNENSDLASEIEELKDKVDGLESDNDYLEEKIEKLEAKLKEANDGLHKD